MNITKEYELNRFKLEMQRDMILLNKTEDPGEQAMIKLRLDAYITHTIELDGKEDKEPVYNLDAMYYVKSLMYLEYQMDAYGRLCEETFKGRDPIDALRGQPKTLFEFRVMCGAAKRVLSKVRFDKYPSRNATYVWQRCLEVLAELTKLVLDPRTGRSSP